MCTIYINGSWIFWLNILQWIFLTNKQECISTFYIDPKVCNNSAINCLIFPIIDCKGNFNIIINKTIFRQWPSFFLRFSALRHNVNIVNVLMFSSTEQFLHWYPRGISRIRPNEMWNGNIRMKNERLYFLILGSLRKSYSKSIILKQKQKIEKPK